jgi:hypothetical protein
VRGCGVVLKGIREAASGDEGQCCRGTPSMIGPGRSRGRTDGEGSTGSGMAVRVDVLDGCRAIAKDKVAAYQAGLTFGERPAAANRGSARSWRVDARSLDRVDASLDSAPQRSRLPGLWLGFAEADAATCPRQRLRQRFAGVFVSANVPGAIRLTDCGTLRTIWGRGSLTGS